jgi:ubiquinone/menaquinone biosynthesis C-methylase UbiE
VRKMLNLAELKPGEVLYDLGAGDGRVLFIAAKEFGARCVGIEIEDDLCQEIVNKIDKLKLRDRVRVYHGDLLQFDLSEADVVTLYLGNNEKIKTKLEKELRPKARVVSHDFEIPGWEPFKVETHHENVYKEGGYPPVIISESNIGGATPLEWLHRIYLYSGIEGLPTSLNRH